MGVQEFYTFPPVAVKVFLLDRLDFKDTLYSVWLFQEFMKTSGDFILENLKTVYFFVQWVR